MIFIFVTRRSRVRRELFLMELHYYYGNGVMILWDHLSARRAAEACFCDERPRWFEFHYFPTYSPELNPVEPCWHQINNVSLANFVPSNDDELVAAILQAAQRVNDEKPLPTFFKHAAIKP